MKHQIDIDNFLTYETEHILALSTEDNKKLTMIVRPFEKSVTFRLYYEWGNNKKFEELLFLRNAIVQYNKL